MNYENIILRKKNELAYAQRRLISAVDDFNQFLFLPDLTTSEEELRTHVTNWKNHVASLESDIATYQRKLDQQSMNWGFE